MEEECLFTRHSLIYGFSGSRGGSCSRSDKRPRVQTHAGLRRDEFKKRLLRSKFLVIIKHKHPESPRQPARIEQKKKHSACVCFFFVFYSGPHVHMMEKKNANTHGPADSTCHQDNASFIWRIRHSCHVWVKGPVFSAGSRQHTHTLCAGVQISNSGSAAMLFLALR